MEPERRRKSSRSRITSVMRLQRCMWETTYKTGGTAFMTPFQVAEGAFCTLPGGENENFRRRDFTNERIGKDL